VREKVGAPHVENHSLVTPLEYTTFEKSSESYGISTENLSVLEIANYTAIGTCRWGLRNRFRTEACFEVHERLSTELTRVDQPMCSTMPAHSKIKEGLYNGLTANRSTTQSHRSEYKKEVVKYYGLDYGHWGTRPCLVYWNDATSPRPDHWLDPASGMLDY
jgi:hypothetical protein